MYKTLLLALTLSFSLVGLSQDTLSMNGYKLKSISDIETTIVKNQYKSGTCWSFAATSFVENEVLRIKGDTIDVSEMYAVYWAYYEKALNYVRFHGKSNFSAGGQAHDVMAVIAEHGMMTEEAYTGLIAGTEKHVHGELDAVLQGFLSALVKNKNGALTPTWSNAFLAMMNIYMQEPAEKFNFKEKETTPIKFKEDMGIVASDYIEITSYTHMPYYEQSLLKIPDNWSFDSYYNVPLDEFMVIMEDAIKKGFTVCWDGDVSSKGFSHSNGLAILPMETLKDLGDTELSKWEDINKEEYKKSRYSFERPIPETVVDAELREKKFDDYTTTDDHLMHLTGLYKDQNGTRYYKTKNSWANSNDQGGFLYMSEAFLRMNSVAFMIHKDALDNKMKKKLGIK